MVRDYTAKTSRGKADGGLMKRAVQEVIKGRSVRQVSWDLKIDRITLTRYVKKYQSGQANTNEDFAPHFNTRQVFTKEEETGLERYILACSTMYHGLGYEAARRLAYEFAVNKGKPVPESWKQNKLAGRDWMFGFMKRHTNVSLRTPEATSMALAQGFNRRSVGNFFELWTKVLAEKQFGADSVFNLDETGITTVQNIPKVLVGRGTKQVGQILAEERGTLVTVCCCVSAVGRAFPPVMIFPGVNFKEDMVRGAPPGTLSLATQSGWMNSELFPKVLEHFIKHMGCSPEKPAVLFMDNHESHLGISIIEMARAHGLSIITFPPHTSHKLQPLDVTVYGPLKTHYKKAVNEWNLCSPGKQITIYDLPECLNRAFFQALSHENITSGFQKTGIWPLNSDIFSEDEFLAAAVFVSGNQNVSLDEPVPDTNIDHVDQPNNMNNCSMPSTSTEPEGSFSEITEIRPSLKRKAADQPTSQAKRADVGCKLITSTPEMKNTLEKLKHKKTSRVPIKNLKARWSIFAGTVNNKKKDDKVVLKSSEDDDDSDDRFPSLGDSSKCEESGEDLLEVAAGFPCVLENLESKKPLFQS